VRAKSGANYYSGTLVQYPGEEKGWTRMNNDADPVSDAWVFNINTLTWKEVCGQDADVVTSCLLRIMWSTLCSMISANAPLLITLQVSLPPWWVELREFTWIE